MWELAEKAKGRVPAVPVLRPARATDNEPATLAVQPVEMEGMTKQTEKLVTTKKVGKLPVKNTCVEVKDVQTVRHPAQFPVVLLSDLAEEFPIFYGFTIYRNVIVVWDEDQDSRIFLFIDELDDRECKHLIAAYESEGGLKLLWDDYQNIPTFLHDGQGSQVDSDWWTIVYSDDVYSERREQAMNQTKEQS